MTQLPAEARANLGWVLLLTTLTGIANGCSATFENSMRDDLGAATWGRGEPSSAATPPTPDAAGPDDYVRFALRTNPSLTADYERWRATVLRISRARRLPEANLAYGLFVQSVETRVGPQRNRLGIRQSFPWPTKLTAGADAVSRRARALQRRYEARALRVAAVVEDRYWRLWAIRRTRDVRREQLSLLSDLAASVRSRIESGLAGLADVQQVDVAIARLDDSIDSLSEDERTASAALVEAIGAAPGTPTPTSVDAQEVELPAANEALEQELSEHPEIDAFRHLADASESLAESLGADRFPGFMVGLDWIETGDALDPNLPDSGKDAVIVSLGLSVPLWQGSYADSIEAAHADANAHRADGRSALDAAHAELEASLSAVRDSARRVRLHHETLIPQALTTYESVLGAYAVGRGSVASLLIAQRDLLELSEALVLAEANHGRAWARLVAVVGRPIRRSPTRPARRNTDPGEAGSPREVQVDDNE